MEELDPRANTKERMADRPAREESDIDQTSIAIDDTAPETTEATLIDDV